ncbi:hypothetical protein BASA81_018565 [Batrachochytrium salamandrivorans]|nr:hypothetical protein BASA81_018565 [Batrachochytrium salamandrivorans]
MVLSLISASLVILASLAGVDARGGWSFVRQSSNGTIGPLYMPPATQLLDRPLADLDDNTYEEGLLDSQPPPDESGGSADDHSDSDPNGDDPPIVKKVVKALVSGSERQKSQKIKVRAGSYITTLTTIVNIGTTGQAFEVSLDSGSDVTWVRNRVCSGNGCSGHSFDSQRSSSFHYGGTPWAMINYADGTAVNYTVCNEALNIGGVGLSKSLLALPLPSTCRPLFLVLTVSWDSLLASSTKDVSVTSGSWLI